MKKEAVITPTGFVLSAASNKSVARQLIAPSPRASTNISQLTVIVSPRFTPIVATGVESYVGSAPP